MDLNNDTLQSYNFYSGDYGDYNYSEAVENGYKLPDFEETPSNIFYHIRRMCIAWYSVTLLLGVIGNGLVIWIAGFRIKSVNAVWFLNLAIADFITCLSLPLRISEWALYWHIYHDHYLCKAGITILFVNMICSVYFMTVISIDRCVSIYWPIWTKLHRTPRLATHIALFIWLFSLLISIPYLVFNHVFDSVTECFPKYLTFHETQTMTRRNAMFITRGISMFAVPFAIILLSYLLLFWKLRKIRKSLKSRRPFQVITIVIISFFICWFPYNTWPLVTISDRYGGIDAVITEVSACLAYFNSCVNPILYIVLYQDLKKNFVRSIPTMLEKVFSERSDSNCKVSQTTTMLNTVNHDSSVI